MKKYLFNSQFKAVTLSLFFLFCIGYSFSQTTIHYWNFNTGSSSVADTAWDSSLPINATLGSGVLTHNFTKTEDYTSTTIVNAEGADPGGKAFCPRSVTGAMNNGNSFILAIPTTGFSNIIVSYAAQRTASGFTTHTVDYSLDGSTFVLGFQTISGLPASFALQTIDFSAIVGANNNPNFTVRITLTGATATAASNRIDNLKVSGSCVTPSQPTVQATTLATSNLQCSEVTLSWVNGDGSNRIVVAKAGSAVAGVPVDQNTYSSNSTFGAGAIIAAGEFVVYNGTGNTVTVKGLSSAATYYFSIFEYNQGATCPNYLTAAVVLSGSVTTLTCSLDIQSLLVDACVPGTGCINSGSPNCTCEGKNEMVRFLNGPSPINTSDIFISWPSNSYLGISPQTATTNSNTSSLNSTIVSPCGLLIEPPGNIIPAGATVLLISSTDMCLGANSFANLADTLYVIYQNAGNFAGHFANYSLTAPLNKTLMMWQAPSLAGDTVTYYKDLLTKPNGSVGAADGGAVNYTSSGVASYFNNGCQAPFASLIANVGADNAICTGTAINLVGTASMPYSSVLWQGGSGTFSSATTLTTTYTPSVSESGTILLSMRLIGFCNDTAYDTLALTVTITSVPTITSPVTYCQGATASALTATGSSLLWYTASSGGVGVSTITPSTALVGTTSYFVSQTINGCEGPRAQINVTVNANPTSSITPNPATICAGIALSLNGNPSGGSGTYTTNAWTGAGAGSLSAANVVSPDFTNATAGSYALTYTVTDNLGCSATSSLTVTVNANPTASIIPNPATTCAGIALALNANPTGGSGTYASQIWTGAGATSLSATNIANPSFTNATAGSYALTYTVTDDKGCVGTASTSVTVNTNPTVSITPSPTTTCAGVALTLNGNPVGGSGTYITNTWTGAGATSLSATNIINPVFTNGTAGSYALIYTVSDNKGCIGTASTTVTVNANPATSITPSPTTTCAGVTLALNGNPSGGSGTYSTQTWTGAGAASLSAANIVNPNFTNVTAGSYPLIFTVTDNLGCIGTASTTVTVNANPTSLITPNPAVTCEGVALPLNGNPTGGSGTYSTNTWTGAGATNLSATNVFNPVFTSSTAGSYPLTYTVTDNKGCIGTASNTITVNANPTASITPSPVEICEGVNISLNGNPAGGSGIFSTHVWSGAGAASLNSGAATATPTFNNPTAGTYPLTYAVTDNKGCIGTASITITVDPNPVITSVPFTNESACGAADGSIIINATGTGLTYSIDGGSAFVAGNTFSPLTAGSYAIVVKNSSGCTVSGGTISISSPGAPIAPTATANPNPICAGVSLTLSVGTPVGGETYTWTGPGLAATPGALITIANITTAMSGTYTVTASTGVCVSIAGTIAVIVNANPIASITPSPAVICAGLALTLNGNPSGGSGTYPTNTWTGAGATSLSSTSIVNPDFTNTVAGTYGLTFTVTDNKGCIGTASTTVTVNANPTVTITPNPAVICAGVALALNGNPGGGSGTYSTNAWTGAGATSLSATNIVNPDFTNATAGLYPLTYTVTDNSGCVGTASTTITVHANPTASITPNPAMACPGVALVLNANPIGGSGIYSTSVWSDAGATSLSATNIVNPNFTNSIAGTYALTYTVTDNQGCTGTTNTIITVNANPIANAGTAATISCSNPTITLDGSGSSMGASYNWGTSNGNIVSGANSTSPIVDQAGTYTLTVTDINGCISSDVVVISSNTTLPIANAGANQNIGCGQSTLNLDGSASSSGSGFTYSWTTSNGNIVANGSTISPTINLAGVYTIIVTNTNNGCTASDSATVSTLPVPVASFTTTPSPPNGTTPLVIDFTNTSQNATTYIWSFGDLNTSSLTNPNNTYNAIGTYSVMLIASDNTLCPDTASVTVLVFDAFSLIIPNVFTPNGDLNNDFFIVSGTGIKEFACSIFDRWGLKVFETDNINLGWNGRSKSESLASDGTYYYIIKIKGYDDKPIEKTGFVMLLR